MFKTSTELDPDSEKRYLGGACSNRSMCDPPDADEASVYWSLNEPLFALCTDWDRAASLAVALEPELEVEDDVVEEDPPPEEVVVVELPETEGAPEGLELHAARRTAVAASSAVSATKRGAKRRGS